MRYLLAPLLVTLSLTGCVSMSHLQRKQDESYHNGKKEGINRVADWLYRDFSKDDMKAILGGMESGEELWEIYFYRKATEK